MNHGLYLVQEKSIFLRKAVKLVGAYGTPTLQYKDQKFQSKKNDNGLDQ